MDIKENKYNLKLLKESIAYITGLLLILYIFSKFIGFNADYVIKYDYFWQHIPFHEEFFRLLEKGFPFWSWNFFLGTNFWGSKVLYIIGDPFTWITYFVNIFVQNTTVSMSYVLILKFIVGYSLIFTLLGQLKHNVYLRLLFSFFYVFSGWSTTFIEQTFFLSFYMLMPMLFIGVEHFIKRRNTIVFAIASALLISVNFYFFWPAAILLLIYWIYRFVVIYDAFDIKKFVIDSLYLLISLLVGLLISSCVWLPGLLHFQSSSRLGSFLNTYDKWELLHISSFFMFSFIPILKYLDGVLKDYWYYFNQFGLYFGAISIMLLPHVVYVFKTKKLRIANSILVVLMYLLLISPKVGLFFHFSYGLRYTFIITFLGIIVAAQVLENIQNIKWYVVAGVQAIIVVLYNVLYSYVLPTIYTELPTNLLELDLLKKVYYLTFVYSGIMIVYAISKKFIKNSNLTKSIAIILIVLCGIYETNVQSFYALTSQNHRTTVDQELPFELGNDYQNAIDYIKSIDNGFYRIYQNNGYLSNINMHYDYKSISTYDSVFQYSLQDFLVWSRQYPNTNWEFRYTEPSFNKVLATRYSIIDTSLEPNYMSDLWYFDQIGTDQNFGKYAIYKLKAETHVAYTYNQLDSIDVVNDYTKDDGEYFLYVVGDMLDNTIYMDDEIHPIKDYEQYVNQADFVKKGIDPTDFNQNWMNFSFDLESNTMVFFSIPFDKGWTIVDNGQEVEPIIVQGGFIGLALEEGNHNIDFSYKPPGLYNGVMLTGLGLCLLAIYIGLKVYKLMKK